MPFDVRLAGGVHGLYSSLEAKAQAGELDKSEERLFKKLRKTLRFLQADPRHPGLKSHEIEPLTKRYGTKVLQSYVDQGDTADRLYWIYGPGQGMITVIGLEPHPEDSKTAGYDKVQLADLPSKEEPQEKVTQENRWHKTKKRR